MRRYGNPKRTLSAKRVEATMYLVSCREPSLATLKTYGIRSPEAERMFYAEIDRRAGLG